MNRREWLYFLSGLVSLAVLGYGTGAKYSLAKELQRQENTAKQEQLALMRDYLARQNDPRKMVRLSFRLAPSAPEEIVQLVADKAYELKPDSRDIVLLDSVFHPELKEKIKELDPLYQQP